jgi:hypothetical protein
MSKYKSEIETIELSTKHAPHFVKKRKCRVPGCERNIQPAGEWRRIYMCPHHKAIREKITRPVGFALNVQRKNARRRKIPYNLSRRHWYYMNYFTLYWKKKGRSAESLTIDRIDNSKGYSDDNVQVVDRSYNARKGQGKDLWE